MAAHRQLLRAIETHSPDGIRDALKAGASATDPIGRARPIDWVVEMYTRSPRFADCLQVLLDNGATIDNPVLQSILLDDTKQLKSAMAGFPEALRQRLSFRSAFTSCREVTPLHVCAEFNATRCAAVLLDAGEDLNARAGIDGCGFGGQTPIFHAVSSIGNYCRPAMEMLIDAGADLEVRMKGLRWGEGYEWDTLLLDVTPISYAQCGLYRQFHREEAAVYDNLGLLYRRRYGSEAQFPNVPNKYLS